MYLEEGDKAGEEAGRHVLGGLRTLSLCSLEEMRLRYDVTALFSFLGRGNGEGCAELFSLGSSDKMHGNGSMLHEERFRLDFRKHFFTKRMVKPWNKLHRELVGDPGGE